MTADKIPYNPWPLGIWMAFGLFGLGTAALIVMASSQRAELVSGDYYEQEIQFQKQMERQDQAKHLGTNASVSFDPGGHRLTIAVPLAHLRTATRGTIHLYRPSAAGWDRQLEFEPNAQGAQTIDTSELAPGYWKVRLAWNVGREEYWIERSLTNAARAIGNSLR